MGVTSWLRRRLGLDGNGDPYVCINCGETHERNYHECPACGGPYVAVNEDA